MEKGLIHVYYGSGKGKTTAALGLVLRALGYNKKVVFLQFLKNTPCGEIETLSKFENVTILRGKASDKMFQAMGDYERELTTRIHNENLKLAHQAVFSGSCDMLVLDEALDAVYLGLADNDLLFDIIKNKPDSLELVITGHKKIDDIFNKADYITEMVKHRHPFDRGISAREGVEY